MPKRNSILRLLALVVLAINFAAVIKADVRFASGKSALKIPFRLYNNHIYLSVGVKDSKPLWFILDTGAPNIINGRNSKTLNLKLTPVGQTSGVGENSTDVSIVENVSFKLSGVTYKERQVAVVNLENIEECANKVTVDPEGKIAFREQPLIGDERQLIDGVFGNGFLKNFVVEIDYAAQLINLYEPKSYRYSGSGKTISLELTDNHIYVRASLAASKQKPVNARLMIDSGAAVALTLNRPFLDANKLLAPKEQTNTFNVCGIGGDSKTQIGSLESLTLDNLTVENPITLFSQASNGVLARDDFDGIIGNAVLRHYKVIFDYLRRRMILESPSKK